MKVVFCAYRNWATNVVAKVDKSCFQYEIIFDNNNLKTVVDNFYPDVIFFIGWSWMVPDEIINKYTSICIHPSKLPKYRGGSPIQNQIIDGINISAVTLFKMNSNLDSGDILLQKDFSLDNDLEDVLTRIESISIESIDDIINKLNKNEQLIYSKQDESLATYCKRRKPEDSEITIYDLKNQSAKQIYDKVRCLQDPYPNAYIKLGNGERLYILKIKQSK